MYLAALDYSRKQMAYIGTEFMEFSLFSPHISRHHHWAVIYAALYSNISYSDQIPASKMTNKSRETYISFNIYKSIDKII